jgi:hypothetical protein
VIHETALRRQATLARRHATTAKRLVLRQREAVAGLQPGAFSATAGRRLLRLFEELHQLTLTSQRQANTALRRSRRQSQ